MVKVNKLQYLTIGVLACIDGNVFASAASGVFGDPLTAFLFGLLCFSGVGCLTALVSSDGDQKDKALGVFFTRLITLILGSMAVFAGVIFGYSYQLSNYIAMSVVFTVSVGLGLGWLPAVRTRRISIQAPLVVLISSAIVTLPFSHFSFSSLKLAPSQLFTSMIGLLIAVAAATLLDVFGVLSSGVLEYHISMSDLRLLGFFCLTLLAIGPIGGFISISSLEIMGLFTASLPILALRKKKLKK